MPRVVAVVVSSVVVGPFLASALSASPPHHATRRAAVSSSLSSFVLSLATLTAAAKEEDDAQEMYFGVGCFWHVQHEFAALEKSLLGRKDPTATAGYAGGLATGRDASRPGKDLVCYHNFQRLADYGKLGHAEVVGVQVPSKHVAAFADQYVALFVRGDRPDKLDVGPEYRSLLGLPGGVDAPSFQDTIGPKLRDAGLEPRRGTGNDPDTLGKKIVWVYDTASFPVHQAEVYHQFHDGFFPGENYPADYNELNLVAFRNGRLRDTGCPDII
mmetsp:Transcript_32754/g.104399  ORF Transcript_32754/g.104399 Transcript_32754/m.104399 type:complete len:271 (-) Transcript_32754:146-958(-)